MVTTVLVMAETLKARLNLPVMRIPILTDHDILFNIQFAQFHPIQSMVTSLCDGRNFESKAEFTCDENSNSN